MTEDEKANEIGRDVLSLRDAKRTLACLQGKTERTARDLETIAAGLRSRGIAEAENDTLRIKKSDRHNVMWDSVTLPAAADLAALVADILETEKEIAEISARLDQM